MIVSENIKLVYLDVDGITVAVQYHNGVIHGSKDKAVLCLVELPDGTREPLLAKEYTRHRVEPTE